MSDIVTRLRNWSIMPAASPASDLMEEAAYEIESIRAEWPEQLKSLVKERDYWMRTARAFDEHLATLRVAMMEHPTVRFGAAESRETVQCPHVVGTTTQYCSLTPLTLTDEERKALNRGIDALYGVEDVSDGACRRDDAAARTLRALLERLG
jgi:predicted DNA-binding transcriptional regulator YafY